MKMLSNFQRNVNLRLRWRKNMNRIQLTGHILQKQESIPELTPKHSRQCLENQRNMNFYVHRHTTSLYYSLPDHNNIIKQVLNLPEAPQK